MTPKNQGGLFQSSNQGNSQLGGGGLGGFGTLAGGGGIPSVYKNISMLDDKSLTVETFAQKKKREELERLERELANERERLKKLELEHSKNVED